VETEFESHCEFEYPAHDWGLQATIFPGEIAFSVPYWDSADAAIQMVRTHVLELSERTGLAYSDPQTGERSI
jgi:hypothetical protein